MQKAFSLLEVIVSKLSSQLNTEDNNYFPFLNTSNPFMPNQVSHRTFSINSH